jgi:hypothetical protein
MLPTSAALPTPPSARRPPIGERWCRAAGVAAALLAFFAGAFAPNPPAHGGTDAAMMAHFRTHYDGTMKGVFTWILGAMALLVFTGAVVAAAERVRHAAGRERGVLPVLTMLTAGIAVAMLVAAQTLAAATAVIGHHATEMSVVRGLDEIGHMFAHLAVIPIGLFGISAALTLRDAGLGARWIATAGLPIGVCMSVSGAWVFVGGQTFHNIGGLCWLATLLWWIAQSVTLVLADRAPRRHGALVAGAEPLAA